MAKSSYTASISEPTLSNAVPDTADQRSHWVQDKSSRSKVKGFRNPWDSAHDFSFPELFRTMV